MNSCLYKANVMHHRISPQTHHFEYNIFMFYVDLDELEMLKEKLCLFSLDRFNVFSFRNDEHLRFGTDILKSTKQEITDYLAANNTDISGGKIMLLTNMNVLGYNFNPVSFYYCFDKENEPVCCIAEVSNTFREMKPYLLKKSNFSKGRFRLIAKKYFYVSPFIDHDTDFDFDLAIPAQKLDIRIDDYQNEKRFFATSLRGEAVKLSNRNLFFYSLRFPLITLRIIFLIHWQALLLWLKKIPFHRKSENQDLQKDVYKKYELR